MLPRYCGFDFRHKKAIGYRNINEIYEQQNQLHCCETLFGDYEASVLVLLQDAANFDRLNNLYIKTGHNPFRHDPTVETNKNLFRFLKPYFPLGQSVVEPNNRSCGVFYANAVWLLKEAADMQGDLRGDDGDLEIFLATLDNLPNLKLIIACGQVPFNLVCSAQNQLLPKWSEFRGKQVAEISIRGRQLLLGSTFHPGRRGMNWRLKFSNTNGLSGADLLEKDFGCILELAGFQKISS
jgi:hypothetical protein